MRVKRFSYGLGCFTRVCEVLPVPDRFFARRVPGQMEKRKLCPVFAATFVWGMLFGGSTGVEEGVRRDFGRLWAAERAGDGRDLGLGRLELGFVSAGVPAIGRNAGGGKKEQS